MKLFLVVDGTKFCDFILDIEAWTMIGKGSYSVVLLIIFHSLYGGTSIKFGGDNNDQ